jgi:ribosomal-protein-alanine N-acetyltransferase
LTLRKENENMPIIAETPRLIVRTWELSDIEALCDLSRQEGISEFSISGYADFSEEQAEQWIRYEMERFGKYRLGKFAVISKKLGVPLGISGIFQMPPPQDTEIELNYRYPIHRRGQGFATEAAQAILNYGFDVLGLKRINANADLRNKRSHAVLERLGMMRIGDVTYEGIEAGRWSITRN